MSKKPAIPPRLSPPMLALLQLLEQGYAHDHGCHSPLSYRRHMRTLDALHSRGLVVGISELTEAGRALIDNVIAE